MKNGYVPLKKALFYIAASLIVVAGSAYGILAVIKKDGDQRRADSQFNIKAIAQNSLCGKSLPTAYLAELLDLSKDHPVNLYKFDASAGKRKLMENRLFKTASIKKIKPGTLLINYELRQPIAVLGDYTNTAIDQEGYQIPIIPFFNLRHLPTIYLGSGDSVSKAHLAIDIYCALGKIKVKQIDMSNAYALSYGQRQIVVEIEGLGTHFLRLSPKNYRRELAHYWALQPYLKDQGNIVIDLRLPQLAFIGIWGPS